MGMFGQLPDSDFHEVQAKLQACYLIPEGKNPASSRIFTSTHKALPARLWITHRTAHLSQLRWGIPGLASLETELHRFSWEDSAIPA